MMHAIHVLEHGGPEVLQWAEVPRPAPGTGELLVRVEACLLYTSDAADDYFWV